MIVPNTNSQTIHQMGLAINAVVRQATGRDVVQNIDMDWVTVAQNKTVQVFSNSIPYMFQRTGGGVNIGNARLSRNKVIGGTLAWNQLINMPTTTERGLTFTKGSHDTELIVNGTPETYFYVPKLLDHLNLTHVYYIVPKKMKYDNNLGYRLESTTGATKLFLLSDVGIGTVVTNVYEVYFHTGASETYSNDKMEMAVYDLTQMLGATIANYLLSLETATAGSGIAWLKKYSPRMFDQYNAYNPGELLSVEGLQSHDMTGFNQWDEEWELGGMSQGSINAKNFIPVLPNTNYYWRYNGTTADVSFYVKFYDANKNALPGYESPAGVYLVGINNVNKTPVNAYYVKFRMSGQYGTTYKNDICINLHWDGERDGEYEPYVKRSYPLDSDLVLRGIPKLDSNNKLYYDGDTYEPDGTVTRKYGIVDLGTLTWNTTSTTSVFTANMGSVGNVGDMVCSKYITVYGATWDAIIDKSIMHHPTASEASVRIKDTSFTDKTAFQTAMSGVYLVYELATPTTEQAEPFSDPQIVSPYGTEEYISTGIVPVGNETQYLELSDTNM